jgi:transposase-like protein
MFKGRQFDRSVILLCVRWYLAYGLSLRDLMEMMGERGIAVDHTTIHRWTVRFAPLLLERFNRRKRSVTGKWHIDETYIKVRGQGMYLYRAIDSVGDTVEFWFSEHRDLQAAKRFLRKALKHCDRPDRIVIDGSQTNREAIISCDAESRLRDRSRRSLKPIRIRQSQYLNNRIEQDHRRIKRRVRPMMGFKAFSAATATLAGIEMVHMMRKKDKAALPSIQLLRSRSNLRQSPPEIRQVDALLAPARKFATQPQIVSTKFFCRHAQAPCWSKVSAAVTENGLREKNFRRQSGWDWGTPFPR